jgi:hypothetical protein
LTHWPKGIYGRAFARAYAEAIGVSADSLLEEVLRRLRTSDEPSAVVEEPAADDGIAPTPLRLTLAPRPGTAAVRVDSHVVPRRWTATYPLAEAVTLVAVLSAAALIGTVADVSFATAAAVVALIWYPIAHGLYGGFSPTRLVTKIRRSGSVMVSDVPETAPPSLREYQVTN